MEKEFDSVDNIESVFYKHRNVIKFEDYDKNDPAIYLGFVCIHFMATSMLPNVYEEESLEMENSRVRLLQDKKYTLKILRVFIKTILNVNVTFNEELFDLHIKNIKDINTIPNDVVVRYFLPEKYMSESDANVFINALQFYFPTNSVKSSADVLPCSKFYGLIKDKIPGVSIWGPPFFIVTHYSSYVVDQTGNLLDREALVLLSGVYDMYLPCVFCRYHYRAAVTSNLDEELNRPFPIILPVQAMLYAEKKRLFEFFSILHAHCKPNHGSIEQISVDHFKGLFANIRK